MTDTDKPGDNAEMLPGMSVMVVPAEVAEKIGELVSQALEVTDDTSGYMFRGIGQISSRIGALSAVQVTPTGAVSTTKTLFKADDTLAPDADTIETS